MYQHNDLGGRIMPAPQRSNDVFFVLSMGTICFLMVLGLGNRTWAQTVWNSLNHYAWDLQMPPGTYDDGDTLLYTLILGEPAATADKVLGIELQLTLTADADLPSSLQPDVALSWLFDDTHYDHSHTWDPSTDELELLVQRNNGVSRSGAGTVFEFILIAAADGIKAKDLIAASGGLVLVDNLEMRIHALEDSVDLEEEPGGLILVDNIEMRQGMFLDEEVKELESPRIQSIDRIDLTSGTTLRVFQATEGNRTPSLSQLPSGMHLLRISLKDGSTHFRKIWKH